MEVGIHTKVAGDWKEVNEPHTKVSGVWKKVLEGHVRVSGSWKKFYPEIILDNMLVFYDDSADVPAAASSYQTGEMLRGAEASIEGTGGVANHATMGTSKSIADSIVGNWGTGWWLGGAGKQHEIASHTHGNVTHNHTTAAINLDHTARVQLYAAIGGKVAAPGAIFFYNTSPSDPRWSAWGAAYDDYYLEMNSTPGTSLGTTHRHGNPSGKVLASATQGPSGNDLETNVWYDVHYHNWNHTHTLVKIEPAGVYLGAYQTDKETYFNQFESGTVAFLIDTTVPDGWSAYSTLYDKMVRMSSSSGNWGNGTGSDTHIHNAQSGSTSSASWSSTYRRANPSAEFHATGGGGHSIPGTHNHDAYTSLPIYRNLYPIVKD